MATLPRAVIDDYTAQLNKLSKAAREVVAAQLEAIEYDSIEDLREQVISILEPICAASAESASAMAAEFYDQAREIQIGSALGAQVISSHEAAATAGAVRALVEIIEKGGEWSRFVSEIQNRADYEIKEAAGECVKRNAALDPAQPSWARVPDGSETCGFCLMLASRGFDYHSMEAAGGDDDSHYHPNCDCRIVPWFGGADIEGYDIAYYQDIYARNIKRDESGQVDKNATAYRIECDVKDQKWREQEWLVADAYKARLSKAAKAYNKDKTLDTYERTVRKTIHDIGIQNGLNLTGQFIPEKEGEAATPDGDEMWAILAVRKQVGSGMFVGKENKFGLHPDFYAQDIYIDIKTPRHIGKVGRRLNHSAEQCWARGQSEGYAILSSLRYEDGDFNEACKIAEEFVKNGTLKTVWAIMPGGEVRVIQ